MRHPLFQHQADDFWAIYKRSTCAVERRRSQLLALLAEGKSYTEVLAITRYSYQGADKIVDAYVAQGLEGIKDQRHGNRGAPTLLSDADLLLAQSIRADVAEGGVWDENRVQEWVKTKRSGAWRRCTPTAALSRAWGVHPANSRATLCAQSNPRR